MAQPEDVGLVLVAAGESRRLQLGKRKPFLELAGRPVFLRSLDVFAHLDCFAGKVLVVNEKDREEVTANWSAELDRLGVNELVVGGSSRQESVRNGVAALSESCLWVAIHDSVRPFVRPEAVGATILKAKEFGAAILAVPMKETVKESSDGVRIARTVPRSALWLAQTPQVFPRQRYLEIAERAIREGHEVTDDAQLFELAGLPVALVPGSYDNIKLTTEADWQIAQALAKV